jgi:hypothetical protein
MRCFRVEWVLLGVWHTTLVRARSPERAAAEVVAAHPGAIVGQLDEL